MNGPASDYGFDRRFGEYGRLAVDEAGERLACAVCGGWYASLASHARRAHRLAAEEYRDFAGLNRQTRLIAPALRTRLREQTAPLIARLRAEGRLRRWNEDPERFRQAKAAAVAALREGMAEERRLHGREALAYPAGRAQRAERRRARNLAGLDRAAGAAIAAGLRRAAGRGLCASCGRDYQRATPRQRFCPDCAAAREREHNTDARRRARLREQLGPSAAPRRSNPLAHASPREAVCSRCNATFTAASHREKYCPPCRLAMQREYSRQYAERERRARGISPRGAGAGEAMRH